MNTPENRRRVDTPGRYSAPLLKALAVHLAVAILLFASFATAPSFEPARPIVQATLVQLDSMSPATTQTDQKIAGEAQRTAAQRHEAEELERRKQEQQQQEQKQKQQEAQRAAAEQAQKAQEQEQKAAEAAAADAAKAKSEAEAKAKAEAEAQRKAAEVAAAKKREEAERAAEAEAAKKRAEAEAARKKAEEEAKRKAQAEADAKRKAAEAAEAKKRAEADAARKAQEDAKAKALADLLADETQYQQAQADRPGDQVAASYDDVIRRYVSEQWRRPPTARNGMVVEVQLSMLPTGQITDVVVTRSSGDPGFDQSAVQAVRNVGRIPEMQTLSRDNPAAFDRMYRQRLLRFKPEDLAF
ncbi:colicin import membrane protein [Halopseudomonas sabulinigri]|uniref:Colicin import membrane protein n=1 Tax=Halopseudomonas sabulinigri TaxID=472181 RepID=A0A1H1XJ31_9GAMM|nr:cell envelope integrity protein TolA [Halopseudomonas sabulinigri]SDT09091.1 colicin import membrane protein [Halopseudomonas sabulinigri]